MKLGPIGVLDSLKLAIQAETDMAQFFSDSAKAATDETMRDVFRRFGAEARATVRDLLEKYRQISGKRLLYLNLNKKRKLEVVVTAPRERQQALQTALSNLNLCVDFYNDVILRLLEPDFKGIFRALAEAKERQLGLLNATFPAQQELEPGARTAEKSRSAVIEAA
ncbi:MAG: hypothetical protein ONB30_10830 [candidate division KSB1 bacterium]|nr:hypothetical protein [candidate division KSB1 bacterium]